LVRVLYIRKAIFLFPLRDKNFRFELRLF
jgi:hypothetical protein